MSNLIRVIVVDGTLPTTTTRTNTAAIVGGVAAAAAVAAAVSYIIYKRKFFFGRRLLPAETEVHLMSDKPVQEEAATDSVTDASTSKKMDGAGITSAGAGKASDTDSLMTVDA